MEIFKLLGKIALDISEAITGLDETQEKGEETEGKLNKVFDSMKKGASVAGKAIAAGLAAGATAMTALIGKALKLSGELEQNMGGSEAVFGEYAERIQDKAEQAFDKMGLSTSNYLATANKMGALFKGAGFEVEKAMDLSSSAMQRAADVASIMGIDVSVAMESVAGAAKGNFTMMDNLGVAINDTTLQAYALEKGITKSTSAMTTQEKVGLAMEMFLDRTAYAAGNYAKENQTLAGSLNTAKAAMTNFLDGSGNADQLVSSFTNAANVIITNLTTIAPRIATAISEVITGIIPLLPPMMEELFPAIVTGAVNLVAALVTALPDILMALISALPGIAATIVNTLGDALFSLIVPVVEKFANIFLQSVENMKIGALEKFEKIRTGITEKIDAAREFVGNAIQKMRNFFNFEWSLPHIKLPHFSISGSFSLNPPSIPHFGVSWYAKAMNNPMLLKEPTIFGFDPVTGKARGGGEAGTEVVSGANTLMNMIRQAATAGNDVIVAILQAILEAIVAMDENMGGNLREALDGMSFDINKREFARLVWEVT